MQMLENKQRQEKQKTVGLNNADCILFITITLNTKQCFSNTSQCFPFLLVFLSNKTRHNPTKNS